MNTLLAVRDAIRSRFDVDSVYVEYPEFIAIPESVINDEGGTGVWSIGPSPEAPGAWSGELWTADGSRTIDSMTFTVFPVSEKPEDIADAVYLHGIGDLYMGGGCPNCPVRNPTASVASDRYVS